MVKDGADRAAKYAAKFDPEVVRSRYAATQTIATEKQDDIQREFAVLAGQVRGILNDNGIPPILSGAYHSFAMSLKSITTKFAGDTAKNEAGLQLDRYRSYTLDEDTLAAIWTLFEEILGAVPAP